MPIFPFFALAILALLSFVDDVQRGKRIGLSMIDVWNSPPPSFATRTRILMFLALACAGVAAYLGKSP